MPDLIDARRTDSRRVAVAGLLAALLAISAQLSVWLQPVVPITLQVFIVVLIALLVPAAWGVLSVGAYLVVGAVGIPVFSGSRGGFATLVGPTGGYLFGFLAGAAAGAWLRERLTAAGWRPLAADSAAALAVVAVVYLLGWLQLQLVTGVGPVPAALGGVVPFIVPDAIKAAAAVAVATPLRRVVRT